MYISVDIIFRKKHIRCFVESLSVYPQKGVVEFEKKDKLNNIVRSYMTKPKTNTKPMFGDEVVKICVPLNGRDRNYTSHCHLPKQNWKALESDFEDLFFRMWYEVEMSASFNPGLRKKMRIRFLELCGIPDDVMNEDSFRKAFDRFLERKHLKINELLQNEHLTLLTIYKSAI